MDLLFWMFFHSIMFLVVAVLWVFTEIVNEGIDISKNMKLSKDESEHSIGETIVLIIILFVVAMVILGFVQNYLLKKSVVSTGIIAMCGIIYAYIAIKEVIKIIFIPEKREFSISDIQGFVAIYFFWWLLLAAISVSQSKIDLLDIIPSNYDELVKVAMMLLGYYFNVLFALGGLYIFLYYLSKFVNKLENKFDLIRRKTKGFIDTICNSWKHGEKFLGLRSFKLWKEDKNSIVYKIFMTIPLLLFDVWNVAWIFVKMLVKMTVVIAIMSILDTIKGICKLIKRLWNRHENNEWMYIFAQMAGICSYVIVFLIIQYGKYEDATKNVYEFVGTIILIPYFLSKIMSVEKNLKGNRMALSEKE